MNLAKLPIFLFILSLSSLEFNAQNVNDEKEEIAIKIANPLANLISVPLQNNLNINYGLYDRNINVLNIQPVIPFANGRIITRTIIPVVSIPDFANERGMETTGLGDIVITGFYVPESKGLVWGAGPVVEFPTGGGIRGSQKWSAGPSILGLIQKGDWTFGALGNNTWSFAGDENRPDVNRMLLNVFLVKQLGSGWAISSAPIITADWTAEEGQQWVVPVGLGVSKLMLIGGKFPINVVTQLYNNVVKPDFGPEWQFRFQLAFVLDKAMFGIKN